MKTPVTARASRTSVDQLGRIEAGEGVAGDIAHVVEAGLLAGQADLIERGDHSRYFVDGQALNLDISAGGDVSDFVTGFVGDKGERAGLRRPSFRTPGCARAACSDCDRTCARRCRTTSGGGDRPHRCRRSWCRCCRPVQQVGPHVEAVFFGFPDFDRVEFTHEMASEPGFAKSNINELRLSKGSNINAIERQRSKRDGLRRRSKLGG